MTYLVYGEAPTSCCVTFTKQLPLMGWISLSERLKESTVPICTLTYLKQIVKLYVRVDL